jgi:hypothetical protein
MKPYNPTDWYWNVGGLIYSSAAGNYVPSNDLNFLEWKSDGTLPTAIANEAELGEVLAPHNLRPGPTTILDVYQDTQARKLTLEVVAKVLFNIVNEICVLKGQAPVTAQQFRNYVKGLM